MTYQELNKLILSRHSPKVPEPLLSLVQAGFNHLDAIRFETFVLRIFEAFGINGSVTPASGDEGVDLVLQDSEGSVIVQCKRYNDDSKVGSKELREFLGAISHAKAIHGYFITTSIFTEQAKSFCADHENITLVDGKQLERIFLIAMSLSSKQFEQIPVHEAKEADLGPEFRKHAEGLHAEYLRELEKLKETFRRKAFRR